MQLPQFGIFIAALNALPLIGKRERLLSVTFQTSFYGNFDFLGN